MMRQISPYFCAFALILFMAGCQAHNNTTESISSTDYSNSTLTGKVIAIDDVTITLQLGELTEADMTKPGRQGSGAEDGEGPSMPSDKNRTGNSEFYQLPTGDADGTLPELPAEDTEGSITELPSGEVGDMPPELPSGEQGIGGAGGTPPEMPNGEGGGMDMGGRMTSFTAGEETVVIDLTGATVTTESMDGTAEGNLNDIALDDILVVEVGENNAVTTATIMFIPESNGEMGRNNQMNQLGDNLGSSDKAIQDMSADANNSDNASTNTR